MIEIAPSRSAALNSCFFFGQGDVSDTLQQAYLVPARKPNQKTFMTRSVNAVFLAILICATVPTSSALAEQSRHIVTVALIEKPWAVSLNIPGYTVRVDGMTPDGRRYFLATHAATSTTLSVTLESVDGQATTQGCLAHVRRVAHAPAAGITRHLTEYTLPKMSVIEYERPGTHDGNAGHFHVLGCTAQENVYADVHMSKPDFSPGDESMLRRVLATFEIVPAAAPGSLDHFRAGSVPYLQAHYTEAIPHYEQALALEQSNPTLDRSLWELLVHNLGASYRMTGDLPRAMHIFEYGISQDPINPLFHYNLARIYAGMNDREHAMRSLNAAFLNRQPGVNESLPDPRQDVSFKRFMLDPSFRTLAEYLMQPAI